MMELRTLERLSLSHKLRKQRSFGEGKADGRKKNRLDIIGKRYGSTTSLIAT